MKRYNQEALNTTSAGCPQLKIYAGLYCALIYATAWFPVDIKKVEQRNP
jgi:hypothetical protein